MQIYLPIAEVSVNVLLLIAPTFAGIMRDLQGDYVVAFTVLAGLNLLGGVLFLAARKPAVPHTEGPEPVPAVVPGTAAPHPGAGAKGPSGPR